VAVLAKKTQGGFLVSQLKQIQGRVFEKLLDEANINEFNGAQGRILYVLWQTDSVPIVELSKKTGLAKTTLTSMLDRMEEAGLINRNYDREDRRQIRITLTEKSRELSGKYDEISEKMSEIYYKGFSDSEIEQFENYLIRIINNLNESGR
jgi:DNA-binding MarR family transcriptional regulator